MTKDQELTILREAVKKLLKRCTPRFSGNLLERAEYMGMTELLELMPEWELKKPAKRK